MSIPLLRIPLYKNSKSVDVIVVNFIYQFMKQFNIINPKLILTILGLGIGLVVALGVIGTNAQIGLSPFIATEVTPKVGGTGGSPTGLKACPEGQLAIGFEGKELVNPGDVEDGLLTDYRTLCGTFDVDYSTGSIKTTNVPFSAGADILVSGSTKITRSASFKSAICPSDSVLTGFEGVSKFSAGRNVDLIDGLRPRCSKLTVDTATKNLKFGLPVTLTDGWVPSAPTAGQTPVVADCASNYVIRGFLGNIGEMFDLFQLACAKLNQASVEFSIIAPNYADYSVITTDLNGNPIDIKHKTPQLLVPGKYKFTLKNNVTGKIYSDFKCTGATPAAVTPALDLTLVNGDSVMCTAIGAPFPPIITTVDGSVITDGKESSIANPKPVIEGTAAKSTDLTIKDNAGMTVCVTKSDVDGKFKCTSDISFAAGSYKLSVQDTVNQLDGNIPLIKLTAPAVMPTEKPAQALSASSAAASVKAIVIATPRTGGQTYSTLILFAMVSISIIGIFLLRSNAKK
jgi:hypothetical protein